MRDELALHMAKIPPGLGGDTGYKFDGIVVPSFNKIGLEVWAAVDNAPAQASALALKNVISSVGIPIDAHLSEEMKKYEQGLVIIVVGKKLL